ncbi:MAG TPA: hypothetical protein VE733_25650 [Streptosporangiaceae bacterium]|nr:hypothetical protein [Streptosporangiaceae bacterium]
MDDSLAVLLLPGKLEGLVLEGHARDLLSIPRVVALEPSRVRPPRFLQDATSQRQARRLRFPGRLRLLVLYHPAQYPLARALCAHHEDLELWYIPPGREALEAADEAHMRELLAFDELARERARQVLTATEGGGVDDAPLRARLRELDVISPRAFIPGGRPRRR